MTWHSEVLDSRAICVEAECNERVHAVGRCNRHYQSWRKSDDFERTNFAPELVPTVCVCDLPIADSLGECRWCFRPFKPRFAVQRAQSRAFLTAQGVDLNIPRSSGSGRDVRACVPHPSPDNAAKEKK